MKNFVKRLLENKRIPSIPYQIYREKPASTYLKFPLILRPANMDWLTARLKGKAIDEFKELQAQVLLYLEKYRQPILVESLLPGRIFFVGIFGTEFSQVLPVCEALAQNGSFHYQCPAKIDWETSVHLRDTALHVFKYLLGKNYALISFLVDRENHIYVADYHPNPSLQSGSIFQLSFEVSDYNFSDFLKRIIDEELERNVHDKN